ncbi:hypothetical protein LS48_00340 [Aequorivita aquimaris]|uniref:Oligosaccharide repeat unit polymerase n=1 Tax=Aequorivita aquimaris TaxID=1548749 RepID=A0A137RLD0_9FLAO|nr:O-antigen polymerase [Aequorivita aquimaris]KXO00965.1 hypothetical protein LS48_00340 [Aequorivita aquimaris]
MKNFLYLLVLLLLIFLTPDRFEHFNANYIFLISILYLISVVYFLYQQSKHTSNWLRFDVMFLIGYTIVHFQIPFLASLGMEPERPSFIWLNKAVVNFATWMSVVAIVLWMLGFSLYKYPKQKSIAQTTSATVSVNLWIYDGLLFLSFVVFLFLVGPVFLSGAYNTNVWGEGANYIFLLLRVLLYLRIFYFIQKLPSNTRIKDVIKSFSANKIFFIVLFLYTLLFLRTGDRGPVMQVALIFLGAYAIYVKPIPVRNLILYTLLGAFVFTIIRYGRGRDASAFDEGNIITRGYSSFQDQEEVNITNELASSVRIQYRALDVVPNSHPYLYGLTFATVGIGIFPFAGSATLDLFNIPRIYAGSANFFTYLGQGRFVSYGEGSEILADIYINFGLYGTFLIMLLFGCWSGKVYNRTILQDPIYVLITLILLASALSMNRGMLFTPLKDIVYILFLNYLFLKVIK